MSLFRAPCPTLGGLFLGASSVLRGDREIVLRAVSQQWQALRSASDELKGDREIVLKAVSQNWRALRSSSAELKGDREIVWEAVSQNWEALGWASDELKGDPRHGAECRITGCWMHILRYPNRKRSQIQPAGNLKLQLF